MVRKGIYTGTDLFKLFAAIGVVSIHTGVPFIDTIGRLGVPFFALISSFFFFKKYLNLKEYQQKEYLFHYLADCKK